MSDSNDARHISIGGVGLHVNRNANIWSEASMYLSRTTRDLASNYSPPITLQLIIVYIVPGFQNPVEFSGTRITIKSRKGPKRVQVEAAIPDIPFPEEDPEEAKQIFLDLMLSALEVVEVYANKNGIINGKLNGARMILQELRDKWDMSNFHYSIPKGLEYYDLPKQKDDEYTSRTYIEKLPNGGVRHYDVLLDRYGSEVP